MQSELLDFRGAGMSVIEMSHRSPEYEAVHEEALSLFRENYAVPEDFSVVPLSFAGQPLAVDAIVPLRASGRNEPFAFLVRGKSSRVVLSADPLNRVSMQAESDTP